MPPPSDAAIRPKPKPIAAAEIHAGTRPNRAAARSPSSRSMPAWLAASCESPPAAAATASPATAVAARVTASLPASTRLRSGSAVRVRCSVLELNSSVAIQTPRTIAASEAISPTAVLGIETYFVGSSGRDDQQRGADDHGPRGDHGRGPARRRQVAQLGELGPHGCSALRVGEREERLFERGAALASPRR